MVKLHFTVNGVLTVPAPGSAFPCGSGPNTVHYSFDFAQQVHYPHNPLQPGPMYFKTARKCAVFGICCEGIPRKINYLIDEASDVGKGANTLFRRTFSDCTSLEDISPLLIFSRQPRSCDNEGVE